MKHGHASSGELSPTYHSWAGMLSRCRSPSHKDYRSYGGRGIEVCPEWREFKRFLADMGERPKGKTLERRDVNGPYSKENCQWATAQEQGWNRRGNRLVTVNGESKPLSRWIKEMGLNSRTVCARIYNLGWSAEAALSVSVKEARLGAHKRHPRTRFIEFGGRSQSIAEWSRELGISPSTLYTRLNKGLSVEDALKKNKNELLENRRR